MVSEKNIKQYKLFLALIINVSWAANQHFWRIMWLKTGEMMLKIQLCHH